MAAVDSNARLAQHIRMTTSLLVDLAVFARPPHYTYCLHMAQIGGSDKRNQIEFSVCRTSLRLPRVLMAVLNETDLYAPVKGLLEQQGYTVRGTHRRGAPADADGGEGGGGNEATGRRRRAYPLPKTTSRPPRPTRRRAVRGCAPPRRFV